MAEHYKPLPDSLEIRPSKIHGHGLFAKEDICKNKVLGIGWIILPDEDKIRTPLGGFVNYSLNSNTDKSKIMTLDNIEYWQLFTTKDIKAGEELTITYTDYDPTE